MTTGRMLGADAGQLQDFASAMQSAAADLDRIVSQVRGRLYTSSWDGRDATAFRRDWEGQLQRLLRSAAGELRQTAGRLSEEALEQSRASASTGGGGWGSSPPSLVGDISGPRFIGSAPWWGSIPLLAFPAEPGNEWPAWAALLGEGRYDLLDDSWRWVLGGDVERGVGLGAQGRVDLGPLALRGEGEAFLGERRTLTGEISAGSEGLAASGAAAAAYGASASASGEAVLGIAALGVGGSAFVGARAGAGGSVGVGAHGATASASASALLGAEARVGAHAEVGGVTAGAGITGYAGIGATAQVDAAVTLDRVSVDVELGVALGLGGGVDVSLDFSPAESLRDAQRILEWRP